MKNLLTTLFISFFCCISNAQLTVDTVTITTEHLPSPLDTILEIKGGNIIITIKLQDKKNLGKISFDLYNESGSYYVGNQEYSAGELESGGYIYGNTITVTFPVFSILERFRAEITCQNTEFLYIAPITAFYKP